jgi:hypothetical protein
LAPFAFAVLGCGIVLLISMLLSLKGPVPWHSLGAPPRKPVEIVEANFAYIVVASGDGSLSEFAAQNWIFSGEALQGTWLPTSGFNTDSHSDCDYTAPWAPSPPSQPIDFIQFGYCPEPVIDERYAILADGTVWRWSSYRSPAGLVFALRGVPYGVVIGFLVGLVVAIFMWRKSRQFPPPTDHAI